MGESDVTISPESPDSDVSREMRKAFYADIKTRYPSWNPDEGPQADSPDLVPPFGIWLVVDCNGRPAGCGGLVRVDADLAEVRRVFVAPCARGHGIARNLLHELEQHARQLGYQRLRLNTGDRQPEALALFRSVGYIEVADFNGYRFAAHWMEKPLS